MTSQLVIIACPEYKRPSWATDNKWVLRLFLQQKSKMEAERERERDHMRRMLKEGSSRFGNSPDMSR